MGTFMQFAARIFLFDPQGAAPRASAEGLRAWEVRVQTHTRTCAHAQPTAKIRDGMHSRNLMLLSHAVKVTEVTMSLTNHLAGWKWKFYVDYTAGHSAPDGGPRGHRACPSQHPRMTSPLWPLAPNLDDSNAPKWHSPWPWPEDGHQSRGMDSAEPQATHGHAHRRMWTGTSSQRNLVKEDTTRPKFWPPWTTT